MQGGVWGSVLSSGTLGNVLSELGLITSYRPNGYLPIDISQIEKNKARISFTLESQTPIRGAIYWHSVEDGGFKAKKHIRFHTSKPGVRRLASIIDSLDAVSGLRFDIDNTNVSVKISDIEIVDHEYQVWRINTKEQYEKFSPNPQVTFGLIDDSGIEINTNENHDAYFIYKGDMGTIKKDSFSDLFGSKRSKTDFKFIAANLVRRPADLSDEIVKQYPGIPTLSIRAVDGQMDDGYGILTYLFHRGRLFERVVDISYYNGEGNRVFSSPVGIRYHGGYHREKYDSYKFYFRDEYGSSDKKQSLIFPNQTLPIRSIVLHHTKFPEFSPIGHLLAIDLFKDIGIDTPRTQPVVVYINNQKRGLYYLTDHLSRRNFRAYFGDGDFRFHRFKSYNEKIDNQALRRSLRPIVKFEKKGGEFPKEHIYENFDVETITNFMVANTVFNIEDYCQGVLYRRDDLGESKWKMVGWDFDGAFMKVSQWTVPVWEDQFNIVGETYKRVRHCPYAIVFRNLLANSSDYRAYFRNKLHHSLDTIYSTAAMKRRLQAYRNRFEGKLGVNSRGLDMLDEYFEKRPDFIRRQTDEHLDYLEKRDGSLAENDL